MTGLDPAEFLSLVEAAALAPSADNRREVQLEHAGRRVRLWGDQTWRSAPEHRRIMSLVAIGAAVENVKLRAGRLGFETKVCWFPDSGNPGLVAEIDVDRLPQTRVDPIEVAIERRRTNRRVRFRGPPLSQGELGALSAEATGIDGSNCIGLTRQRPGNRSFGWSDWPKLSAFDLVNYTKNSFRPSASTLAGPRAATMGCRPGLLRLKRGCARCFVGFGIGGCCASCGPWACTTR